MLNIGRWFAAWACFGMLLYPAAPVRAAAPPSVAEPSVTVPSAAAEPSTAPAADLPRPVAATSRPAPLDVSFIPAEAAVAIITHPRPLLSGPNAEWMPVEVITASGMQQFGVDPVQIEEVLAFLIPPPSSKSTAAPEFGVIIRFAKPYDKAALVAKLRSAKEVEVNGATCYVFPGPEKFSVHLPDNRTVILGADRTLPKMLAAKDVDSPLVKLLKNSDCSGTYTVLASLDAMRDLITESLVKIPPLPPPLDQFRKLPMLISSLKVSVDLSAGADFSLTMHAVDDQASGELLDLVNSALAMGRQAVLGQILQEMRHGADDPVQQATMQYTTRIVNRMFDVVKPVRTGRNVKVAFHYDTGVAAIGVMVALLLPAVQAAREAARRNQSMGKIKQLGLSLLNYENAYGRFPQRAICDKQGKPLLSWRVAMLPYLDEAPLYKEFHLDEPWDSPHNKQLIARIPDSFCNPRREKDGKTNYLVPVGPEFAFDSKTTADGGRTIADITDGTSRTIAILEADEDRAVIWTKPEDLQVNPATPLAGLGHFNSNGTFLALFFDDHVQSIPGWVDPQVFKAALTIAGGETVRLP